MGKLINRLLVMLNDSDPSSLEYHLAMALLENFGVLKGLTIGEVAELCGVSKSAISKFVRRLGYEDYAAFRADAKFQENRFNKPYNYNTNIAEALEREGFRAYADAICADVQETLRAVDTRSVTRLAREIASRRTVAAFGLLFSEYAALDLQTKLAYNDKFVVTKIDDQKQQEFIDAADEDTLLILYSNSGDFVLQDQMDEFHQSKDLSRTRARVALVTSNPAMADDANVDICVSFARTTEFRTHANLYPLVNDLIVAAYRQVTRAR